ncbi:MAG: glycosyltransferase family 4 protein [Acidobacteria bacterium]|nr:glycosyltransferase family 4 protein [Acidobacteriota bacterium]
MKILQVSSARLFGGGERHLVDLARGLAERGHDIYAALPPGSPLGAEMSSITPRGIVELPLRNALDLRSALRLARFVRENKVQIIHAHVARDYPLAAIAARRSPLARLVVTRHVMFPLSRAHRLALANVSRVVAVSEAVARTLRASGIFPAHKIRVVPNAVDVRRFQHARGGFETGGQEQDSQARQQMGFAAESTLRVGIVGELSEVKGQEVFIRAARLVSERFAGAVEFIIVGGETSPAGERRTALEKLVAQLGLDGRVRFTGHCDDVAEMLSSLDVFVSASSSESFGIALVEAMASGLAIVTTATDGAREIIEDGLTGTIVPIADPDALAAAVLDLLGDTPHRHSLGVRAREVALERFTLERMIADTERVYMEALGR